jgi:hypothetical protein
MKKSIKELYDDGRFEEARDLIASTYPSPHGTPDEILAIAGWCLYRCKEYKKADGAGVILCERGAPAGFEIRAQIAAYVTKDDELLQKLYWEKPNNPSIANAIVIRSRDDDSNIATNVVTCIAHKFMSDNQIASVHIINNAARTVYKRSISKSLDDAILAIGLWEIALKKYGRKNYHHKAAVHYWLSQAYESLGEKKLSFKSAQRCADLWKEAIRRDPKNPKFQENFIGAKERLKKLLKELR